MTPKERKFRKNYAPELLRLAEADLKTGRFLLTNIDIRVENAFFHLQQCIEKSLKAVLCHRGKAVPLTHEIAVLIATLGNDLPPHASGLGDLSQFAAIRRYEEGTYEYTDAEKTATTAAALETWEWAKRQIGARS
jgi:HEPN domain-containing protein